MSDFIQTQQVNIFITLEILMVLFLLCFLFMRYLLPNVKQRTIFLVFFFISLLLEALLVIYLYQSTGEVTTFQIVIIIFIAYACTFGIADFKKLDRYLKLKIGKWRGVQLLTDEELWEIELAKHPKVIAKKYRVWWYFHTLIIVVAHAYLWFVYGNDSHSLQYYITHPSWWVNEDLATSPFNNLLVLQVSKLWLLIYAIDTIIAWSYTFFPDKEKLKNN